VGRVGKNESLSLENTEQRKSLNYKMQQRSRKGRNATGTGWQEFGR